MPHEFTQALCNVTHDLVGVIGSNFLHALLLGSNLLLLFLGWVGAKHVGDFANDFLDLSSRALEQRHALLDGSECSISQGEDADWIHILQTKDLCKQRGSGSRPEQYGHDHGVEQVLNLGHAL